MKDMNRADLLNMREGGMGNVAIAKSLGCSTKTVFDIIGPQPPEITKRNRREAMARAKEARWSKTSEGGYTVERKMMSFMPKPPEEEPVKAVLVMKSVPPTPIPMHGVVADYTISADRKTVEIEAEKKSEELLAGWLIRGGRVGEPHEPR